MITRTQSHTGKTKYTKSKICRRVLKSVKLSNPQIVGISWDSPAWDYCKQIIWCCNEWKKVPRLIPVGGNGGRSQPSIDKTLDHLSLAHQLLGWLRMNRNHTWRKRGKRNMQIWDLQGKTRTSSIISNELINLKFWLTNPKENQHILWK